tara:strand:- start:2449 stop:2649 length:201 start_codon:yes stop_codon:yes gene_type:complete
MGKTLESYVESSFDEYIENFFVVLNLFITKTIRARQITPIKGDYLELWKKRGGHEFFLPGGKRAKT